MPRHTCTICVGHENGEDLECVECNCHSLKPCGKPAVESVYDAFVDEWDHYCARHWDDYVLGIGVLSKWLKLDD